VIWGLKACRSYITGSHDPIIVLTDNKALTWLKESDHPGRVGRWQAELHRHTMEIRHRRATQNNPADCMSRNAIETDVTGVVVPRIRRAFCQKERQRKDITIEEDTIQYSIDGAKYTNTETGCHVLTEEDKQKI
jgi:hypothetical protein